MWNSGRQEGERGQGGEHARETGGAKTSKLSELPRFGRGRRSPPSSSDACPLQASLARPPHATLHARLTRRAQPRRWAHRRRCARAISRDRAVIPSPSHDCTRSSDTRSRAARARSSQGARRIGTPRGRARSRSRRRLRPHYARLARSRLVRRLSSLKLVALWTGGQPLAALRLVQALCLGLQLDKPA